MNVLDNLSWQWGQGWRQFSEGLEYQLRQLFSSSPTGTNPDWLEPLVVWVARGLAVILGLAVFYLLVRLVWPWWQKWRRNRLSMQEGVQTAIARPRPVQEWLEQARMLQAQEDYAGACRALYMALLIRLEEGGWLNQDPSRTDREYLHGLESLWILGQRPGDLWECFPQIFLTHEQLYYGNRPIAAATFQTCQDAYFNLEPEILSRTTVTRDG